MSEMRTMTKPTTAAGSGPPAVTEPAAAPAGDPAGTAEHAVVLRTKDGWRVGGTEVPDLTSAMVLADLLSAELAAEAASGAGASALPAQSSAGITEVAGAGAVPRGKDPVGDPSRLRATIGQLEHALTARIRVEQAIGVLAERHRIQPRQAFEQLRAAARSRGKRVIDVASDVVASATNPLLQLPDELSRPRSGGRRSRQRLLGSE